MGRNNRDRGNPRGGRRDGGNNKRKHGGGGGGGGSGSGGNRGPRFDAGAIEDNLVAKMKRFEEQGVYTVSNIFTDMKPSKFVLIESVSLPNSEGHANQSATLAEMFDAAANGASPIAKAQQPPAPDADCPRSPQESLPVAAQQEGEEEKPVVAEEPVRENSAAAVAKESEEEKADEEETNNAENKKPFEDHCVIFAGKLSRTQKDLSAIITANGGTIAKSVADATLCVCTTTEAEGHGTQKGKDAVKKGVLCVNEDFVDASVAAAKKLVDLESYILANGQTKKDDDDASEKKAETEEEADDAEKKDETVEEEEKKAEDVVVAAEEEEKETAPTAVVDITKLPELADAANVKVHRLANDVYSQQVLEFTSEEDARLVVCYLHANKPFSARFIPTLPTTMKPLEMLSKDAPNVTEVTYGSEGKTMLVRPPAHSLVTHSALQRIKSKPHTHRPYMPFCEEILL